MTQSEEARKLGVSRQRVWQMRKTKAGLCKTCGKLEPEKWDMCKACARLHSAATKARHRANAAARRKL